jgi:hypothetical protein
MLRIATLLLAAGAALSQMPPRPVYPGFELVYEDDFLGSSLNASI